MASRRASTHRSVTPRGFSLIEILVVLALFVMVAGVGLFVSMDSYRGFTFRNERDIVVSLLQKARSQAINNMCFGASCTGGRSHGVHFAAGQYVVFQGQSYAARDAAVDETVLSQNAATTVLGDDVIFSPLAATTTGATVTVTESAGHSSTITVDTEGAIRWTN